jgi:hypothetical protein
VVVDMKKITKEEVLNFIVTSLFPMHLNHQNRRQKYKEKREEEAAQALSGIEKLAKQYGGKVIKLEIDHLSFGNNLLIIELRQIQLRLVSDRGYNLCDVREIGNSKWKRDELTLLPNDLIMGDFYEFVKEVLKMKTAGSREEPTM